MRGNDSVFEVDAWGVLFSLFQEAVSYKSVYIIIDKGIDCENTEDVSKINLTGGSILDYCYEVWE
jgi:hypothetical protein